MDNSVPDYKETIRQEWTGAAPLWQRWNPKFVVQTRAATALVIDGADLAPGMHVLDLASGTGEPSLSVATAVGPTGRVVATDLVPEMLDAAQHNARAQGHSHMEFRMADAEQLPFAAAEFDRVTCRFGLMFFPDVQKSLSNIRRVLKPGGRVSFLSWGSPQENVMFSATMGPFQSRAHMPPPPPDAPTIFRFADPAKLAGVFTAAGFRDTRATKHQVPWPWPGPPEEAWEAIRELAAPFRKVIESLPPNEQQQATQEVLAALHRLYDGRAVKFSATVILATASA